MTRIILVHGACHGAWCWRDVVPALVAQGHEVVALNMPGRAGDTRDPAVLTMADQAQTVLDAAGDGAIMVGHSAGGFAIAAAAEAAPDKALHLVFVAALLPVTGMSLGAMMQGMSPREGVGAVSRTPDRKSYFFETDGIADDLYNGVSDKDAEWAVAQLCAEPSAPHGEKIVVGTAFGSVPKTYVRCTQDRMIPSVDQARMARDGGTALIDMDTGHSPFLSDPAGLAAHIDTIAKGA